MKTLFKITCATLFLAMFTLIVKAQAKIDETNIITRLTSLSFCSVTDAAQYFTDRKFTLISKKDTPKPNYTTTLYKYKLVGQTDDSYLLMAIGDKVTSAGRITYSKDEYEKAVEIIIGLGYTVKPATTTADADEVTYAKDNYRFITIKKTSNNQTFYLFTISDVLRAGKIMTGRQ